jgi:hypothetical protein
LFINNVHSLITVFNEVFSIVVFRLMNFSIPVRDHQNFGRACAFIFNIELKKVKVTLVQALRFCTGRTAHRGSRE